MLSSPGDRWIGDGLVSDPVRHGELHRLDDRMQRVHPVVAEPRQVVALEDSKRLQHLDPGGRWRDRCHLVGMERGNDGCRPLGTKCLQVLGGEPTSSRLHGLAQSLSDVAPVQQARTVGGQAPQRLPQIPVSQDRAGRRDGATRAEERHRLRRQALAVLTEEERPPMRQRESLLRVANGRGKDFRGRQPPMRRQRFPPPGEVPRHQAGLWPALQLLGAAGLGAGRERGPPHEVQDLPLAGLPQRQKQQAVPADPRHERLHHVQRGGSRHRGVHGVSAPPQHLHGRAGRQGMRGAGDTAGAHDGRPVRTSLVAHVTSGDVRARQKGLAIDDLRLTIDDRRLPIPGHARPQSTIGNLQSAI